MQWPPAEHWPEIRSQQNRFRELFGEHFRTALFDQFWAGCSDDGSVIGFQFILADEIKARAALPVEMLLPVIAQLAIVAEIACERHRLAHETEGVG